MPNFRFAVLNLSLFRQSGATTVPDFFKSDLAGRVLSQFANNSAMEADALIQSFEGLSVDSALPRKLFEGLPQEVLENIFDRFLVNDQGRKCFRAAHNIRKVSSPLWPRE